MLAVKRSRSIAAGCGTSSKQLQAFQRFCSLAKMTPSQVHPGTTIIGSDEASEYTGFVQRVAPELTDRSKIYNLTSAVFRKFARKTMHGSPKVIADALQQSTFSITVPAVGWVDGALQQPPNGAQGGVESDPRVRYRGAIEGPSDEVCRELPERTYQVNEGTPSSATQTFFQKLVHEWARAGLLQPSGTTLSVPASNYPSPVRIQGTEDPQPTFYHAHIEDSVLSQIACKGWTGPTHVVAGRAEAQDVVDCILRTARESHAAGRNPVERVLGFDIEFKPRWNASLPESPPTVVQVATAREVFVFHVKHFTTGVRVGAHPSIIEKALQPLMPLFRSEILFKVGVGVDGDVSLLTKFAQNLTCRGFHDMTPVALGAGFKRHSLRALSALLLGHAISKKQQKSNWDKPRLTEAQVEYAATDAWVSREIAIKLAPLWLLEADR